MYEISETSAYWLKLITFKINTNDIMMIITLSLSIFMYTLLPLCLSLFLLLLIFISIYSSYFLYFTRLKRSYARRKRQMTMLRKWRSFTSAWPKNTGWVMSVCLSVRPFIKICIDWIIILIMSMSNCLFHSFKVIFFLLVLSLTQL